MKSKKKKFVPAPDWTVYLRTYNNPKNKIIFPMGGPRLKSVE